QPSQHDNLSQLSIFIQSDENSKALFRQFRRSQVVFDSTDNLATFTSRIIRTHPVLAYAILIEKRINLFFSCSDRQASKQWGWPRFQRQVVIDMKVAAQSQFGFRLSVRRTANR